MGATKQHCFDISSSGYVNLLMGYSGGGDSKECVKSRSKMLATGHYKPISDAVCELANKYFPSNSIILDAGCGEGYYTNALASKIESSSVIGIDLSRPAVDMAAKAAARGSVSNSLFSVAGIFDLPVGTASLDGIVNLFAPCAEKEFCRALKDDGILIVGGAGENHLYGFKKALYDSPYKNDLRADLPKEMKLIDNKKLSYKILLQSNDEIINLFAMTPYYYRTSEADRKKLFSLNSLETEIEVELWVYGKDL